MIEIKNLTKVFRDKIAVDDLSLVIRPGVVTGFLGPNGAGKTTTMKMILGLTKPTRGEVRIDGQSYKDLKNPLTRIGALIDGDAVNPAYTAKQHMELIATASGISLERVEEILKKNRVGKGQGQGHRRIFSGNEAAPGNCSCPDRGSPNSDTG